MRRKLGKKNKILFVLFSFLIILLVILFVIGIRLFMSIGNKSYDIASGSIIFDKDYKYIKVNEEATIKKGYNGNYKLKIENDNKLYKNDLGKHAVVYYQTDYKMYFYGDFYQILLSGEVIKMNGRLEIIKNNGPFIYKLQDRKYLIVDKNIESEDKSINTKNYLIVEIDKNGNASFANNEILEKTINPIVLNCSNFVFDIANEKIKISSKEINLKNVIGSSNMYVAKTDKDGNIKEPTDEELNNNNNEEDKTNDYYASYFNKIVNSFNNLTNSINNDKTSDSSSNLNLDLTRWITLSNITPGINSAKIEYMVFDPNNEYKKVFVELNSNSLVEKQTIQLSKEKNSYIINDLKPDSEYTITLGYVLNEKTDDIKYDDVIKIRTSIPKYELSITKLTVNNEVHFALKADKDYLIDKGEVSLYIDGKKHSSLNINVDELNKNNIWNDRFFGISNWNNIVIKLENLSYNNDNLNIDVSSKYVK